MILPKDLLALLLHAAPSAPGRETPLPYLLLNLFLPLLLGTILAWLTRWLEKGLLRLMREKR